MLSWHGALRAVPRRRLLLTLAAVSLLLAAVWSVALERSRRERDDAVTEEAAKNANLALAHGERAARSFQLLDQILLAIRAGERVDGHLHDIDQTLAALNVDRRHVGVVAVIDAQGVVLATNLGRDTNNYADRAYFQHHATAVDDHLLIGQPVIGKVTKKWVITLTRPRLDAQGRFDGVIFMALDPGFIASEYAQVEQGPNGSLALIGLDGVTRVRRNGATISYGGDVSKSQLFTELPKARAGHYVGVAASDGQRRLVAYRTLDDLPVVSVVASSYDAVLAVADERAFFYNSMAAGSTLALLLSTVALLINGSRRAHTLRQIEASERRFRRLFEHSLDAVIGTPADGRIDAANPAAIALFGPALTQAGAVPIATLFDAADPRHAELAHRAIELGSARGEVRMRRGDGQTFEAEVSLSPGRHGEPGSSMIVRDVTQRQLAEERIRQLAFFDALTLLPNRRLLTDRLKMALAACHRHRRQGALLFVDLDNFKQLNDTLGHQQGDVLLQQAAQRLQACLREGDTCARLGGDEFVVMLEDLNPEGLEAAQQAEVVGDKIIATLSPPYTLGVHTRRITPSVGITLFDGQDADALDGPLKRADLAMYQAKAAGGNTLRFFDPQMQATVSRRVALESSLREALQAQAFELHYQPQIDGSDTVIGVEALLRWPTSDRGMVSPAEFIPLAEATGLIVPLGLWVLETACAQLAEWAGVPALADLSVSVNVSERQFREVDFVERVLATLARTGARPGLLKLELTEGLLVTEVETTIAKMQALRAAGVQFSLDDFGTGYSSLAYLKLLPLDELKIDQSFVRDILVDPNDAAIANMVIALGRTLELAVVAEGVETEAQRAFLREQGCRTCQGYLFSRPVPAATLVAWLQARRA